MKFLKKIKNLTSLNWQCFDMGTLFQQNLQITLKKIIFMNIQCPFCQSILPVNANDFIKGKEINCTVCYEKITFLNADGTQVSLQLFINEELIRDHKKKTQNEWKIVGLNSVRATSILQ